MKMKKIIKLSALTLGLYTTSIIAPNVLSNEGIVAQAQSVTDIPNKAFDNLDRKEFFNDIDINTLRQVILKAGLEEINETRKAMGVYPLEIGSTELQKLVYKHSRYASIEYDLGNYENKSDSKYFTGYSIEDRLKAENEYNAYDVITENLTYFDTWETNILSKYLLQNSKYNEEIFKEYVKDEIRTLYLAPYQGANILTPYRDNVNIDMYVDVNLSYVTLGVLTSATLDMYDNRQKELSKPYFYPYDGQTGTITHVNKGSESSDPIADVGLNVGGTPLTAFSYNIYENGKYKGYVKAESAILINTNTGKEVQTKKVTANNSNANQYTIFIPVQKLEPKTQYKVVYTYKKASNNYNDGTPVQFTIKFTTGEDTNEKENIKETSDRSFTYKGKTYDMTTHNNSSSSAPKPIENTVGTQTKDLIKTTDTEKLARAVNEAQTLFNDFNQKEYWADAVVWMYANGIMSGGTTSKKIPGTNTTYRQFMPNTNLTEVQLLAMLFRYSANDVISKFPASDTDYGAVYYNMANAMGLPTKGDAGANRAKGDQDMTREEMAIMFVKVITGKQMSGNDAIQFLYDFDIASGSTATRVVDRKIMNKDGSITVQKVTETYAPKTYESFDPKGKLTRAHVAAFFYRTQQKIEGGKMHINRNF